MTDKWERGDAKYIIAKVGGVMTEENISWLAEYLEIYSSSYVHY